MYYVWYLSGSIVKIVVSLLSSRCTLWILAPPYQTSVKYWPLISQCDGTWWGCLQGLLLYHSQGYHGYLLVCLESHKVPTNSLDTSFQADLLAMSLTVCFMPSLIVWLAVNFMHAQIAILVNSYFMTWCCCAEIDTFCGFSVTCQDWPLMLFLADTIFNITQLHVYGQP